MAIMRTNQLPDALSSKNTKGDAQQNFHEYRGPNIWYIFCLPSFSL